MEQYIANSKRKTMSKQERADTFNFEFFNQKVSASLLAKLKVWMTRGDKTLEDVKALAAEFDGLWGLISRADDRCRSEHFPRRRRMAERLRSEGLCPGFDPARPCRGRTSSSRPRRTMSSGRAKSATPR